MKNLLIIILLVLLTSCSKDYLFNRDQVELSKKLKEIKNADQGVRNHDNYIVFRYGLRDFSTIADSLDEISKYNEIEKFDFSKIPSKEKQMKNWSNKKKQLYDQSKQESEKMMDYVDKTNRAKLYKIVKKYGYPSFYNRKWNDTINLRVGLTLVFTHYNYQTKEEKKLLKLIVKEYLNGRVGEGEMKQFLWSADGRIEDRPYNYIIKIEDWKKRVKE